MQTCSSRLMIIFTYQAIWGLKPCCDPRQASYDPTQRPPPRSSFERRAHMRHLQLIQSPLLSATDSAQHPPVFYRCSGLLPTFILLSVVVILGQFRTWPCRSCSFLKLFLRVFFFLLYMLLQLYLGFLGACDEKVLMCELVECVNLLKKFGMKPWAAMAQLWLSM